MIFSKLCMPIGYFILPILLFLIFCKITKNNDTSKFFMYLFLIFPSIFLLRDKEAIKKRGRSYHEEGKKQESSLFLMNQNMK